MPADPAGTGTGARRQGGTEPERNDDTNRRLERQLDEEGAREAVETVHTRGRQPGAHGNDAPHRNVKPGTRAALEDARE